MQLVSIAESKDLSADGLANHLHNFDSYWRHQQAILEDKCRQLGRLPTIFLTIAPAEWTFPLHAPTLSRYAKNLSEAQGLLTLHIYQADERCYSQKKYSSITFETYENNTTIQTGAIERATGGAQVRL